MENITIAEKLRIIMGRKNMTVTALADGINMSRQNLSNKFSRNSFTYADVEAILHFMNYEIQFIDKNNLEKSETNA